VIAGTSDDAGVAAIDVFVTIIIGMVPVFVIVMSAPSWVERLLFARAAAQEAARAVVVADSWDDGAAEADRLVDELAANHDVPAGATSLSLSGELERGSTVSATVSVQTPTLTVPFVTTVGSTTLSSTHSEVVDHYRSLPP
jgi:hypothetical protein